MRRYLLTSACVVVLFAIELIVWDGDTSSRLGGSVPAALLVAWGLVSSVLAVVVWRWPVPAAVAVWVLALIAIVVPSWQPFGAVLVALYVVARTCSAETARLALPLALVPLGVNAWNSAGWQSDVTLATFVPVAAIWLFVAMATWGAGRAGHRSDGRVEDLEKTLRTTEAEVRAHERRLIARDLHDIVAHSVTAMVLRAAGAKTVAGDDPALSAALTDIEESGAQAVRELHRLLHTMHGSEAADTDPKRPGLGHLTALVDRTRGAGLRVEVHESGERRALDASLDLTAYRCVQEALSNAMRHAGPGATVDVRLVWGDDLEVEVTSVGGESAPRSVTRSGGFGLVGLSERVSAVDGRLEAGPVSGGFRVRALLPTSDTVRAR